MQAFEYATPTTLPEATALLGHQWGEVDVLAGGTDQLALMKDYRHTPRRLVDIKGIRELHGITKTSAGVRIGALTTLTDMLASAELRTAYPSLVEAARGVSSVQVRHRGTFGGDLCQRPRCWYFRQGLPQASAKDGDNRYSAIFGNQGPVYFVSASSFGPALVALGAKVTLVSKGGTRELPAEKFFVIPASENEREIAMRPDEILTHVLIPPAGRNATYEVRQKLALDWPLVSASVALHRGGARIVLGHVAPIPWRAAGAEKALAGKQTAEEAAEEAGKAAADGATPLSGNAYKVRLVRVAVKRALLEAAKGRA